MWKRLNLGKVFVYALLIVIALSMLLPFVRVVSLSISSRVPVERNYVKFLPQEITMDSYRHVMAEKRIW